MKKLFAIFIALNAFLLNMSVWAQDATEKPRESAFGMQTIIMIAIALVFFYFILWKPEQKRRKKAEQQRSSLKKGDRVTAMGIIGTIAQIKEQTIVLRMVDGSKIEMLKGAISDVQSGTEDESKKSDKDEKESDDTAS